MNTQFSQLPHSGIQTLHPYQPGKSVEALAKERNIHDVLKLASNENPLGCSPRVTEALSKITAQQIAAYPSPAHHPFYAKLAAHLDVPEDMLVLSNGSDALFTLLMTCFALHRQRCILTHEYAFIAYPTQAQALGIPVRIASTHAQGEIDVQQLIAQCNSDTALIFIANPNNPTGLGLSTEKIAYLAAHIPLNTLLVIDEAYYEYNASESALPLLKQYPNLVITRTFSKAYGLAGLRLGYAVAHTEIIHILKRVLLPFAVNQAVLNCAIEALEDQDFLTHTRLVNQQGMTQMRFGLEKLGLNYIPSQGNFITFDCQTDGKKIYNLLEQQGIIVRPLHPYGLPNHLRVTIGTDTQNARFLEQLTHCYDVLKGETVV